MNHAAERTAQWAAVALGFSIPISTALDNVLLAVVLVGWLASGAWQSKWQVVRGNRVALAAMLLYGLLLAGTLYGAPAPGGVRETLTKYLDLLLIPVLAWLFRDAAMRTRAIYTLAASLALVLALSFLLMSDVIPRAVLLKGDSGNPIVFKTRQTHGLLMAYGAFLFAQLALAAATRRARIAWSVLALLAAANGLLVVPGATGYLVLGALVLYLGFVWQGWRGIALALCAGAAAVIVLISVPGPFKERVHRIQDEIVQWQPGVANEVSSVGTRLEFYRVSLKVVANRPFLGHGTGSFAAAFAENTRGQDVVQSGNPHNEYLHIMVQLGLVGLAGLFILFWTHWQLAPALATPLERHLARGLLLAMLVGCLFNSWLMDHVEGLHYAWLTGLLFAGLKSPDRVMRPPSPVTVSG